MAKVVGRKYYKNDFLNGFKIESSPFFRKRGVKIY